MDDQKKEKVKKGLRTTSIIIKVILAIAGLAIAGLIMYILIASGIAIHDAFRDWLHL